VVLDKPKDVLTQIRLQDEGLGHWINIFPRVTNSIENKSRIDLRSKDSFNWLKPCAVTFCV